MKKLLTTIVMILATMTVMGQIADIENGESGSSVRGKLNQVIDTINTYFPLQINPDQPPFEGTVVTVPSDPADFGTGTASKDGILYVAIQNGPNTGFIELFDLNEDPLNPTPIDTIPEMNDAADIIILGSYMYVINGSSNNNNGSSKFNVYDVEDATNPKILGSANTGNFGVILKHYKGKIFTGTDSGINLWMVDATDPASIQFQNVTAAEAGGTLTTAIAVYEDYLLLGERPGTGIKVFDLAADPLDPPYLFTIPSSMNSATQIFRSLEINGTHLWGRVSTEDDDGNQYFIFSLDSLELGSAREIGKYNPPLSNAPTTTNQTFKIYNDNLIAPDQFGLHIYDISDLDNITEQLFEVNGGGFGAFVKSWTIWNNVLYIANGSTAGVKFYAIPFGDKTETFSGRFGELTTGDVQVRGLANISNLGVRNTAIIQALEVDSINGVAYTVPGASDLQAVMSEGSTANITTAVDINTSSTLDISSETGLTATGESGDDESNIFLQGIYNYIETVDFNGGTSRVSNRMFISDDLNDNYHNFYKDPVAPSNGSYRNPMLLNNPSFSNPWQNRPVSLTDDIINSSFATALDIREYNQFWLADRRAEELFTAAAGQDGLFVKYDNTAFSGAGGFVLDAAASVVGGTGEVQFTDGSGNAQSTPDFVVSTGAVTPTPGTLSNTTTSDHSAFGISEDRLIVTETTQLDALYQLDGTFITTFAGTEFVSNNYTIGNNKIYQGSSSALTGFDLSGVSTGALTAPGGSVFAITADEVKDRLYVSVAGNVLVYVLSTEARLASEDVTSACSFCGTAVAINDRLYVLDAGTTSVKAFDISTPTSPVAVPGEDFNVTGSGSVTGSIKADQGKMYVAFANEITVYDIATGTQVTAENITTSANGSIDIKSSILLTTNGDNTVSFFNFSNSSILANLEIDMSDNKITDLTDPTDPQDAATKAYVDAQAGGGSTEGSFTPALQFGGATTGITYVSQNGYYHKQGRVVNFVIRFFLSSKGTATGFAQITGLPFDIDAGSNYIPNFSITYFQALDLDAGYTNALARDNSGSSGILDLSQSGDNLSLISLDDTNFANNTIIEFSGVYFEE